jgi:2-polyprenyl-6-methoxyphenol hydroxylase-like FAD-dependent oxidoreductase
MRLELHPDGNLMIMPQSAGWVGLAVLVDPKDEALFRAGALDDKVAAIHARSAILRGCSARPKGSHLYQLARGHAPRYVARGAVLIGDAVHVTNPTAGQGMTMAIEDAASLARAVGPVLSDGPTDAALDRALAAYESDRRPKNAALVRWSHWMGRFFSPTGLVRDALRRRFFSFAATPIGQALHRTVWGRVATRPA